MAGQMAAIPAALLSGFKELFELLSNGASAISKLAARAAELKQLSRETDLSLASLQKLDYVAQIKGLKFDKIQEDLPKLVEKYKAEAEGKSFEQFLFDLSGGTKQINSMGLNRETVRLLGNDDFSLEKAFDQVDSKKLVLSDEYMNNLAELNKAINSMLATRNSVGSERIAGNAQALQAVAGGMEDLMLKGLTNRLDKAEPDMPTIYKWRIDPMETAKGVTPWKHTPLDPVEMWNEALGQNLMQHSPRPYDFGDKYREKAEQVSQTGDSIIGALSKFGEKINQVCTQLAPFSDVLQSIVQQIPYLPPPTQAEIDACHNKPGIFARGGILQAKLDAIRGPGEGPTPWTGVSDTALALNAAGTTGLSLGAGGAGRAGFLDANTFHALREAGIIIAAAKQTHAEQALTPFNSVLLSRSLLTASNQEQSRAQGMVIHDNHTSNIYVTTSDPVRAGEVAAKAAATPYATPGAYAPAAC